MRALKEVNERIAEVARLERSGGCRSNVSAATGTAGSRLNSRTPGTTGARAP